MSAVPATPAATNAVPRLLVIMGSGETSPTMVKVHRQLLSRLGPAPVPAVLLDTPYGFQENADDLVVRAQEYFKESVNLDIDLASYRTSDEIGSAGYERSLTKVRNARYVFAGPGSPTYALRQWAPSLVPQTLAEKLRTGGCVTFASAAALTLGTATVPVYEVYKGGAEPHWLPGLDLLAEAGLHAAVIPHYNNAEGGGHDTRFCYLGERRLAVMERQLPGEAFVLGVDEHTGLVLDLDEASATVVGIGGVTVRRAGVSGVLTTGTTIAIGELPGVAAGRSAPIRSASPARASAAPDAVAPTSLLEEVRAAETAFSGALDQRDVDGAVEVVLRLEQTLVDWSRDTLQSDELAQARAALRGMIVRLGEVATTGVKDPAEVIGPFVEALLQARSAARADKRYADADALRDTIVALGVEVQDGPAGTKWALLP